MRRRLPPFAVLLGLGGLVPFVATGAGVLVLHDPARAAESFGALVAYAAVILSFLGAVHWGLALADETGRADAARFGFGVVPSLLGWVALLAAGERFGDVALLLLGAGFAATIAVEQRAATRGLLPRGYLALRWTLTTVVLLVLAVVLVSRLAGWHVR